MRAPNPVYAARRANLVRLLEPAGARAELARRLAVSPARVTHLTRGNRRIHEDAARAIEGVLGLPRNGLDQGA